MKTLEDPSIRYEIGTPVVDHLLAALAHVRKAAPEVHVAFVIHLAEVETAISTALHRFGDEASRMLATEVLEELYQPAWDAWERSQPCDC